MGRQQILDTLESAQLQFTGSIVQGDKLTDAEDLAFDLVEKACRLMAIKTNQ